MQVKNGQDYEFILALQTLCRNEYDIFKESEGIKVSIIFQYLI